ncbi:UNVERIFIED_CONTAM: hypothetical protein GTU68_058024 [Idotea baltica]|nr:hypothetical protein [Idotea baltica]
MAAVLSCVPRPTGPTNWLASCHGASAVGREEFQGST